MNYIVNSKWLKDHVNDVRVVDCSFQLGNPSAGFNSYVEGHIPGAVYFDLEKDLSSKAKEHGGRHPLPNADDLVDKLSSAGIDEHTKVVAYDSQDGMMASRFWWLLHYLGHENVYILDGGYQAWVEQGNEVSTEIPTIEKTTFTPSIKSDMLVGMQEVKGQKEQSQVVLIDSRDSSRFAGINEPVDKKAGHIPGAVNYFWKGVLNEDGSWKSVDQLKEHFSDLPKDSDIIVYCGSGVSACPNIISLTELGYKNVKLYLGSWSDWISYPDNPIGLE